MPLPPPHPRSALGGSAWLLASVGAHAGLLLLAMGTWGHGQHAVPSPPADTRGTLAGETFEIPTDTANETTAPPVAPNESDRPASEPAPSGPGTNGATAAEGDAPSPPRRATKAPGRRAPPSTTSPASAGATTDDAPAEPPTPVRFGATGDRAAVDLASAFTRGLPQAASADPLWLQAPLGSAGTVDVDLTLDDAGAIADAQTSGTPGAALSQALRRTLALLNPRAFVADGKHTRLRVTATITADAVHDGLHGEVFAIGGSFDRGEGSAFFALAVGRRIDIHIRQIR